MLNPCCRRVYCHPQDEDDALALEACEFWSAFADSPLEPALLAPHLPRLVPLLLKNMVYDEFDEEVVDTEAAEAGQAPDNDADVRPFHHRCGRPTCSRSMAILTGTLKINC